MTQSFRELMARDGPAILAGAHNGLSARQFRRYLGHVDQGDWAQWNSKE